MTVCVFWIQKSSARDYFKRNLCHPKQNPDTGLYILLYTLSNASTRQVSKLNQHSSKANSMTKRKNLANAFKGVKLAKLSHSGFVPL